MPKKKTKEVAIGKRLKISKFQKQMILMALVSAVTLGMTVVISIFLVKYIIFNSKVISEKDKAIEGYDTAIANANVLKGKLLDLANNKALESVARGTVSECYSLDGVKIDYEARYQEATSEEESKKMLDMMRACSALRVIPDALPAHRNDEALMSSLDQIFKISGWEPESLSPGASMVKSNITGLGVIPISLSVEANAETTFRVLDNIERSIRSIDVTSANISWSDNDLRLNAQAVAYYTDDVGVKEETKTVYASNEARKAKK